MNIEWLTSVNQNVLDTTNITIGNGGYEEDSAENGKPKDRRLTKLTPSEEYAVTMRFDYAEKDSNGKSEYIRFLEWYNDIHKRGVNPFYFPSLRRYLSDGTKPLLTYKIKGGLQISKHGLQQEITMNWVEDYQGPVKVPSLSNLWLDTVNMKIVDSTSATVGDGGVVTIASSSGVFSNDALTEEYVPDSYNVTMDFDWLILDENNESEFDRFIKWFLYGHKRGTRTFPFASLKDYKTSVPYKCYRNDNGVTTEITEAEYVIGKANSQEASNYSRINQSDVIEYYKITSPLKCQKSGYCMRVSMTWQNVKNESREIFDPEDRVVDHIEVENGQLFVYYTKEVDWVVSLADHTLYKSSSPSTAGSAVTFNDYVINENSVVYKFDELDEGTYFLSLDTNVFSATSDKCFLLEI